MSTPAAAGMPPTPTPAAPAEGLTHRQILKAVWGPEYVDETHYLRVYFAQIRRKLEPDPGRPRYFITEPGLGYRFEP